jgi:cobalamin synthase
MVALVSVLAWYVQYPRLSVTIAVAMAVTFVWGVYLYRRLGGQSGDLLGAGNCLVEASVLLVALAAHTS